MSEMTATVVFDFDLTLTKWDTADRFFRWLLKRDPWRLGIVVLLLPVLLPLLIATATRKLPIRFAVWVATLGRSQEDLLRLVREHADSFSADTRAVFLQAGLERLQSHLAQGHRVVVATGSLEVLAKELLARAGYDHVPLVGSTLRSFLGGMARDQHCFGPNKIPMLAARGFSPPWAITYTDHRCDLPILELSLERYLINPKPECIRAIEQALNTKATILAWQ